MLYTVIRTWRDIEGDSVDDAVSWALPGEHDEVRVKVATAPMAELILTASELDVLMACVSATAQRTPVEAHEVLRRMLSLMTAIAEARYGIYQDDVSELERAKIAQQLLEVGVDPAEVWKRYLTQTPMESAP